MSAGGLLVDIPERFEIGTKWELAMDWTGLYHGCQSMRLSLIATVTRTGRGGTALRILSARFREANPTRVRLPRTEKNLAVA
jgi:hypothetical protein